MEFYAITHDDGTVARIFAVDPTERREWRLDGSTWCELDGSPVLAWLLDGRVDLDAYGPPPGALPPLPVATA